MKPTLLLIGYRAYGDWLYAMPSLSQLLEQYDIHLETNSKGWELFHDDPRFVGVSVFDAYTYKPEDQVQVINDRWRALEAEIKPDRVINLWRTLETECLVERYMPEFEMSTRLRQSKYGHKVFYDSVFARCDTQYKGNLEGLYFTPENIEWAEKWSATDDYKVLMVVAGSLGNKIYPYMPQLAHKLLDNYPNVTIYMMGDSSVAEAMKDEAWTHPRIVKTAGTNVPFKQAVLMAKYADFVFGGETGLLVAAGMWGTPKMMLCTTSGVYQAVKYHKNDLSMQSGIHCSPCHKAVYSAKDCGRTVQLGEDLYSPECIFHFDHDLIYSKIEGSYLNAM